MAAICKECAEKSGGKWPDGHLATCWVGECVVCDQEKECCDTRDWGLGFNRRTKKAWHIESKNQHIDWD